MTRFVIRSETEADRDAIRNVHRSAFQRDDEGKLVDDLRETGHAAISLVADYNGRVVGHILLSKLEEPDQALALAPVGVSPDFQKQGIGVALIQKGLERARVEKWNVIFVLGSPDYYKRFGFSLDAAKNYDCRYSGDYFMALRLDPAIGSGKGKVIFAAPFNDLG